MSNEHSAAAYDAAQPDPRRGHPPKHGETTTGHIHIRTTLHRKSAYVRAAKPKPLAEWVIDTLDRAVKYKDNIAVEPPPGPR